MTNPSFENDPPKKHTRFCKQRKGQKKIPKPKTMEKYQHPKKWKPQLQNARFRKSYDPKTEMTLQTLKRTSKCQVSNGYDPTNKHDFVNSEQT